MNSSRMLKGWCVAVAVAAAVFAPQIQAQSSTQTPATLIQVYADALVNNAAFRARLAQVEASNQVERQAKGQLYPQFGVSAGYDYIDEKISGDFFGFPDVESEDDFDRKIIAVSLTQGIYRPDVWLSLDQAELGHALARFQLDSDEDMLLLDVAKTYFEVLSARDLEELAKAEQDALGRQLEQAQSRHAAGLLIDADLADARAQVSLSDARILQARAARLAAVSALELIAGKSYPVLKVLPEGMVLARPNPPDMAQWVERAREQNLAVLGARISAQIAELEVQKSRKLHWPKVNLTATGYQLDAGGGATGERDETEGRIGVKVDLPLYSGGSISAKVAESEANYQAALAEVDGAIGVAVRDTQIAFLETTTGIREVPARRDAVIAARLSDTATTNAFEAGTRTTADVLRVIRARYEAERDYSEARYEFVLDSLRLKQAAGNLTNADLMAFDRLLRVAPAPKAEPTQP
ncbi:MAG: TolC family outer membrane protein [Panacagrimonas sp.]